jgi:hypothetical protein
MPDVVLPETDVTVGSGFVGVTASVDGRPVGDQKFILFEHSDDLLRQVWRWG